MFNDSYTNDEWQDFMSSFVSSYWSLMKDNSIAYICLDWRRNHELIPHIKSSGFHRSNIIVWDKIVHGLGSDYKYTYELINVCKKGKPKLNTHQGDREYSDVWHIQRVMGKNDDHATAKPIELVERAIRHASNKDDVITDLFGGSGSTLIACEKLKRKCFMMELDPKYCDVIIKRYENYSGKKAVRETQNGDS
jgi:DNA modification methylase